MKHFKTLTTILLLTLFAFTSCSIEELATEENEQQVKTTTLEKEWNAELNAYIFTNEIYQSKLFSDIITITGEHEPCDCFKVDVDIENDSWSNYCSIPCPYTQYWEEVWELNSDGRLEGHDELRFC